MTKSLIKHQDNTQQRITVYFGYGLFLFTIITLAVSLVPLLGILDDPKALHWNVIATMTAFAVAAIVPPIVGYFVGDASTRDKSHLTHRYNGVLFAILGYWITVIVSSGMVFINLSDIAYNIPAYIVGSFVPVVVAVITLIVLGIFYARHTKHQRSLLSYLPFRIILLGTVGSLFVMSGISIAYGINYGADLQSSLAVLLLPVVMIAVLVAFGAWAIGAANGGIGERLVKSVITLSYAFIAMTFVTQLLWFNQALSSWGIMVAIVLWIVLIIIFRRHPTTEKGRVS